MWGRAAVNHSHWARCEELSKLVNMPAVTDYSCTFHPATFYFTKVLNLDPSYLLKVLLKKISLCLIFVPDFFYSEHESGGGGRRQQKSLTSGENFKLPFSFWNEIYRFLRKEEWKDQSSRDTANLSDRPMSVFSALHWKCCEAYD